jgi:hypothetical protein
VKARFVVACIVVWAGAAGVAVGTVAGCSSGSGSPEIGGGCQGGACAESGTGSEGGGTGDAGGGSDAAHPNDGSHDGAAPDALYGACAIKGSFGWPCTASGSGPDPTDCTDPNYPDCFVGGQGAWCTKTCAGSGDCTTGVEDAGCIPASCNGRGYCK